MLRPQDIVVLLDLVVSDSPSRKQQEIARAIGLSQGEVHNCLRRCAEAGLYDPESRQVMRHALLELLVHGLKYFMPAVLGGAARGVPTGWAAPPLAAEIVSAPEDRPVWPHPDGHARGQALEPIYHSAPDAALANPELYELLALIDAIRIGRARERKRAAEILTQRLSP